MILTLSDVQKENIMKGSESISLSYVIVREFLLDLKKEFREEDNETIKIIELKRVKQRSKTIKNLYKNLER